MALLSPEGVQLVKSLKHLKIFQTYSKVELAALTQNGGSALFCGDGDIDAFGYHAEAIERPHHQALYGGPLLLAHSFKDFDAYFAECIIRNMKLGLRAKKTNSVFQYFHYPCAVAAMFGYSLEQVLGFVPEVINRLSQEDILIPEKIYAFFHFKWEGKEGKLIQKTYRFVG